MSNRTSSIRHESFNYPGGDPFLVLNIRSQIDNPEKLLNHWHEELELAYSFYGRSIHRIDGETIECIPGRLIVTNPESVHGIIPAAENDARRELCSVVILLSPAFLEQYFPEYRQIRFINQKRQASFEIREICEKLSAYARWSEHTPDDKRYAQALITELLYFAKKEDSAPRGEIETPGGIRKTERLKVVLQYIEEHYTEPITLSDVSALHYFNQEYFSRYFKKNIGISFSSYLRQYRLRAARKELLTTDKSITEIALHAGFSDERALIKAFKQQYDQTPLQYRKSIKSGAF